MSVTTTDVARPRTALAVLCAASFLAVVDTTIVSIALPTIRNAMGLTASGSQWVLNSYALVFGGLLLLFGRLGDRMGRRRLFVAGLVVFAGGSVLAGASVQPWMLFAGRVVQGLAAGAFVPNSLSLLTATFAESRSRSRAIAAYGAMAGLGFVAGMVGGGVITEVWGWRWIFLINVPVVAVMLPLSGALPEYRGGDGRGPVDAAGGVAVTTGLAALIFAVTSGPRLGWLSAPTVASGLLGLAAIGAFIAIERRHPRPLVPPSVVARRDVAVPNAAVALQSMVGIAWLFLLTLFFQDVRAMSPLVSGLWFTPMTVASVVGAAIAGRAALRFGIRPTAVTGQLLMAGGLVAMTLGVAAPTGFAAVITGMVLGETGFMLGSVAFTIAATSSLDDHHAGLAAGLLNTATQLGGGVGLGIVASLLAGATGKADVASLQISFLACIAFSAGALVLAGPAPSRHPASTPAS
jgi:EmrB/QacA subfamily drug resistance transporter